jgi:hypothetical protein
MGMVIEHVQATNVRDHIVLGSKFQFTEIRLKSR